MWTWTDSALNHAIASLRISGGTDQQALGGLLCACVSCHLICIHTRNKAVVLFDTEGGGATHTSWGWGGREEAVLHHVPCKAETQPPGSHGQARARVCAWHQMTHTVCEVTELLTAAIKMTPPDWSAAVRTPTEIKPEITAQQAVCR